MTFATGLLMSFLGSAIWSRRNYLGSEISRSQMCYWVSEICCRRNYLGSDISGMSLSKPFFLVSNFFRNWTADYLESLKKLF